MLKAMGHDVESSEATAVVIARVEAILLSDGWLQGAADGRAASKADGY
ncbi:MAG: hypothetical protein M3Y27_11205 [Acidobacteriota bacterium]|nr:hypothetical protein [Acidobacteriota bacterium]